MWIQHTCRLSVRSAAPAGGRGVHPRPQGHPARPRPDRPDRLPGGRDRVLRNGCRNGWGLGSARRRRRGWPGVAGSLATGCTAAGGGAAVWLAGWAAVCGGGAFLESNHCCVRERELCVRGERESHTSHTQTHKRGSSSEIEETPLLSALLSPLLLQLPLFVSLPTASHCSSTLYMCPYPGTYNFPHHSQARPWAYQPCM